MPILEKKEERSQINYLLFHFKKLEKEEPNKLKTSRTEEIIQNLEWGSMQFKKLKNKQRKSEAPKFFSKTNKFDKPLKHTKIFL